MTSPDTPAMLRAQRREKHRHRRVHVYVAASAQSPTEQWDSAARALLAEAERQTPAQRAAARSGVGR